MEFPSTKKCYTVRYNFKAAFKDKNWILKINTLLRVFATKRQVVVKRQKQPIREIKHNFLKETQAGFFISKRFRLAFCTGEQPT